MGFRSDRQLNSEWRRFIDLFSSRLSTAGIPAEALKTERAWLSFVDHLYLTENPDILDLETWSTDQLAELCAIFEEIEAEGFHAGEHSGVLGWLRDQGN